MAPSLDSSLGALEVGVITSTFLLGVLTLQTYLYYSHFPSDGLFSKIQVAVVWFIELGNAICISHVLYIVSVTNYGQPAFLIVPPKSLAVAAIFASLISPTVQIYFAHRIYKFSRKLLIPIISTILSIIGAIGNLTASAKVLELPNLEEYVDQWAWLVEANAFMRVAIDTLITTTLVGYFYAQRHKGYSGTGRMLDKLIKWTVETGLITAITSTVEAITLITMRHNYVWIALWFLISRSYANSYLAVLNSRLTLRAMKEDIIVINTGVTNTSPPTTHQLTPTGIQIELTKSVVREPPDLSRVSGKSFKEDRGIEMV